MHGSRFVICIYIKKTSRLVDVHIGLRYRHPERSQRCCVAQKEDDERESYTSSNVPETHSANCPGTCDFLHPSRSTQCKRTLYLAKSEKKYSFWSKRTNHIMCRLDLFQVTKHIYIYIYTETRQALETASQTVVLHHRPKCIK